MIQIRVDHGFLLDSDAALGELRHGEWAVASLHQSLQYFREPAEPGKDPRIEIRDTGAPCPFSGLSWSINRHETRSKSASKLPIALILKDKIK